jgi:hypothetical protein
MAGFMLGLRDLVALGAQHVGQVAVGFQDAVLPAACTLVAACIQIEAHGLARLLGIARCTQPGTSPAGDHQNDPDMLSTLPNQRALTRPA